MKELIDITVAHSGPLGITLSALSLLIYFYIVKAKNPEHFDKSRVRVNKIDSYIVDKKATDPVLQQMLLDERDHRIFSLMYGYRLDAVRRRLIEPITKVENAPISWATVKGAKRFIGVDNGALQVKYTRWEKVGYPIQTIFANIMIFIPFLLSLAIAREHPKYSATLAIGIVGIFTIFIMLALMMVVSAANFGTALRLEKWLRKNPQGAPHAWPVPEESVSK